MKKSMFSIVLLSCLSFLLSSTIFAQQEEELLKPNTIVEVTVACASLLENCENAEICISATGEEGDICVPFDGNNKYRIAISGQGQGTITPFLLSECNIIPLGQLSYGGYWNWTEIVSVTLDLDCGLISE